MLPDSTPLSFPDFHHFSRYLDSLGLFHMDLSLDRVRAFLDSLGRPPRFTAVQVVGTNGKGSTACFLESVARAHGLRTGLFTSPHFLSVRERMLVDGAMLEEGEWVRLANQVMEQAGREGLTYFELLFAMAVLAFDQQGVDLAVFEAGLGGQWDATTVLPPGVTRPLVLFTPFGLDHEHVLGQGLTAIARDKAMALEGGMTGMSGPQLPEAVAALKARAGEIGVGLQWVAAQPNQTRPDQTRPDQTRPDQTCNDQTRPDQPGPDQVDHRQGSHDQAASHLAAPRHPDDPDQGASQEPSWLLALPDQAALGLRGPHQKDNARLALAGWIEAAGLLNMRVEREACLRGLEQAFLPGRLQLVEPDDRPENGPFAGCRVILDGAHNAPALESLATGLADESLTSEGLAPSVLVTAIMADKNLDSMLPAYRSLVGLGVERVLCVGIPGLERLLAPGDLAARLSDAMGVQASEVSELSEAGQALLSGGASDDSPTISDTRRPTVLLCGSLYLLAEFYRLYPQFLRPES